MRVFKFYLSCAWVFAGLLAPELAAAAPPSKEECIEAHGRGQDQREAGQVTLARESFAICSQPVCPALVQTDCAQFTEQLAGLIPSVSFAARNQRASDLPDTQVYVDGKLVARRLDEGKSYDVDPGRHSVLFVHGAKELTLTVIVTEGERGRNLVATFSDDTPLPRSEPKPQFPARDARAGAPRSTLPLVLAVGGGLALATGSVLTAVGFSKIPGNCSFGSRECAAPPGDGAFNEAHSGVSLVNVGVTTAIAGAVLGLGGLIWYWSEGSPGHQAASSSDLRWATGTFVF